MKTTDFRFSRNGVATAIALLSSVMVIGTAQSGFSQAYPPPTIVSPAPTVVPPVQALPLPQLVMTWGYQPVACTTGIVTIRTNNEVVCVSPNPRLPAGDYIYDRTTNQISPAKVVKSFEFTNAKEYSDCVEDIIRLYQDRSALKQRGRMSQCMADVFPNYLETGVTKAQARQFIESANFHATSLLGRKLYPPRGQRMRVTQYLGFIYDIDANNPTFQQLATQGAEDGKSGRVQPGSSTTIQRDAEVKIERR